MSASDEAFLKYTQKTMKPMLKAMATKQKQMSALLVSAVNKKSASAAYWNRLRTEINIMYAEMQAIFSPWAKAEIPKAMRRSITAMMASINANKKILETAAKSLPAMLKQTYPLSALLALETSENFLAGLAAGQANVIRFTRATQQVLMAESQINMSLIRGLADGGNLGNAAKVLSGDFWSKMYDSIKGEQFIQAGKYKYTPEYYAEMVARTKFHEAQSMAAMATAKNYDTNLLKVSSHNTMTEICVPYEGNIYSTLPNDPKYPPLEDTPPYHPNCLHLLWPIFGSAINEDI